MHERLSQKKNLGTADYSARRYANPQKSEQRKKNAARAHHGSQTVCSYTDAGGAARFCSFNVLFCPSKKGPNEGRDVWQLAYVKPLLLLSASLELCSMEHLLEHTESCFPEEPQRKSSSSTQLGVHQQDLLPGCFHL